MSCGKIVNDECLFCLTCGRLRFDYENVKLDSLDYTLTGEEFMMQVANQFSDVSSRYFNLMDDFSQSVENYRRQMDDISKEQKMKSSSFAMSMNAVEGMFASEETQKGIAEWQNGDKKFIAVFSDTLKRYGFPVGV